MRVMLNERKQHDDYCCLKGDRYRSEKFPALADDLRIAFKVQLHYELSIVMLAVITDHKMRCHHNVAFIYGQKQAEQVLGKGVPIGESTMEACRRIWRRLLVDVERKATDEDFLTAFRNLHLPGSSTLPL